MPKLYNLRGYYIFFWSNEQDPLEPVHVHVGRSINENATKIWILKNGTTKVAHNHSKISQKELKKICKLLSDLSDEIVKSWEKYFKRKATYLE